MMDLPDSYQRADIKLPGEGGCAVIVITGCPCAVKKAKQAAVAAAKRQKAKDAKKEPKPCGCGEK